MATTYGYGGGGGGGGYQNTSYGAQGGADGGGFVSNGGGFGSQGGEGSQDTPGGGKAYGKDTLRPLTIKQIIEAHQPHPEADFKVDGQEMTQITFVGQVRTISTQATNITYKIDDGTGLIEVKQWIDTDAPDSAGKSALHENAYVRVWGRLKEFNNKRTIGAHFIRPITDFNEISMHLLEATYVHLYFTRGPPETLVKTEGGGAGGMFVDQGNGVGAGGMGGAATGGGNVNLQGLSTASKKVFGLLQNAPQNTEGLHVTNIAAQLLMPQTDVYKAGDELLGKGIIYTTVDDDTWAVLEY